MAEMSACRFCGAPEGEVDIFIDDGEASLSVRAMRCARIVVVKGDGLPDVACRSCRDAVHLSYAFCARAEAVDRTFRSRVKIEPPEEPTPPPLDIKETLPYRDEKTCCTITPPPPPSPSPPLIDKEYKGTIDSDSALVEQKNNFICHNCGKKCTNLSQMRKHISLSCGRLKTKKTVLIAGSDRLGWLKCTSRKTIKNANLFNDNIDKQSKRFMCDICGNTFKNRQIMIQHQKTHLNVKLFSCNICKKKFSRSSHVVSHMRIHNNIKPYVCEICGRSFIKSSDLNRHRKIHFDARDYPCSLCNRRFKRSTDVTSHMRSHTGDRPYVCKCGKAYTSHSSLKKHKKLNCVGKSNNCAINDVASGDSKPKTELQT